MHQLEYSALNQTNSFLLEFLTNRAAVLESHLLELILLPSFGLGHKHTNLLQILLKRPKAFFRAAADHILSQNFFLSPKAFVP